ncbi:NnrU family protein [Aliiroseovarius sp.]|uniref:NnrU family protein n=1 Tax=Aliiroseovarius sp. TaxID=1872442 RepID=UPI0026165426|nr:NnrU family protein [Aliiroseovarius sp.]
MLGGWGEFLLAFAVFFLSHSIPTRPGVKAALVGRLGARGFTLAYSALSTAVLAWVIFAAARAPIVILWPWAMWQNHVPVTAMALAVAIAVLAIGRPNPLSFGGAKNDRFDPRNPGLAGWIRHPLLVALALWAGSHLVPNGNLAHVILFGLFGGFALMGMKLIDRRQKRLLGAQEWARLSNTTRRIAPSVNGVARLVLAGVIYLGLLHLHGPVLGVYPLP